ncbi:MAG: Rne/Rng family ribonuclease [candidate division NC10 bacterium]
MKREIIVNSSMVETRVAILEDGQLAELMIGDARNEGFAGNIYKGRVQKILPGMQAAFVDIGLSKDAFLFVRDIYEDLEDYERIFAAGEDFEGEERLPPAPPPKHPPRPGQPSIEELLQEGQEVLVQVAREPLGTKGARITSHITLPGRFLVYMPTEQHIGISRKIEDEKERVRLRQTVQELSTGTEGVIVRTAGMGKKRDEIAADLEFLRSLWRQIRARAETVTAPALVQRDLDLVFRIFRDLFTREVARLVVDSEAEYVRCVEFVEALFPDLRSHLFLYTEEESIFRSFGVEREIEKALRPKVWLKSGGYLVIEETEALVSIDVNTGRYVGKHDFEETVFKTNLEAAREIARQVRLRDLGGIVIVDFIDMARKDHRDRVLAEFKDHLKSDRSPTNVALLSELGLVEMTRKRVKQGLIRSLSVSCPTCGGTGLLRAVTSVAHQVLREAEWRMVKRKPAHLNIRAHPDVINWLRAEEGEAIEALQQKHGGEISLAPQEGWLAQKYQVSEG